jgi:hypothetical protein
MIIKTSEETRDDNIKLNSSYALIGVVVVVAFTAGTALLLVLYSNASPLPPSFDYRAFAQEEDNKTTTTADNTTNTTNLSSNSTLIDFVSNIEQIRAHLNAAMMNKQTGNNSLAQAHTMHPIAEIYSSIEPQIANANMTLNQTLASNLNELSQIVNSSTTDEFNTQAQKINGLVNQTVKQVVPVQTGDNSTFGLAVVTDLLSIASEEYGEAIENGTIKEIVEYQDGQAFVSRAQDLMIQMSSSTGLPQEKTPEIQETNKLFSDLNTAIQNKSSPEVVDTSIRAIIHKISEITGISEENLGGGGGEEINCSPAAKSREIISEIRTLLNQTIQAHKQQNYAEAEALATTAYLDNYEFIEAPLAEKDNALMENTEVMLREQLRQLIQNKVSIEELQEHIDKINSDLDKAEELLATS